MMPGLAALEGEVATEFPQEFADDLWRLVYTRGHCDVDRARPYADRDHSGILVYARSVDELRALVVVETGDRLVGAVGAFGPLPRVGSAVRLAAFAAREPRWRLLVDEAFPLAVSVRFDRAPADRKAREWVDALRCALHEIRAVETLRRDGIAARRRMLPALADLPSAETAAHAGLPEVRRRIREVQATNAATRSALAQLEVAYGESRARTQTTFAAWRWLDALASAPLAVEGLDTPPDGLDDPARANDVLRAIALLARALPRGATHVAV